MTAGLPVIVGAVHDTSSFVLGVVELGVTVGVEMVGGSATSVTLDRDRHDVAAPGALGSRDWALAPPWDFKPPPSPITTTLYEVVPDFIVQARYPT